MTTLSFCSPLKTRKASLPQRFFPRTSVVEDYYFGNLDEAFRWILESDLTFVMFYAPWDAKSMETREAFDLTAKRLSEQVRFVGINCWWPEGECRQHFRRIRAFPVLMAFPGAGKGIQYRGPDSVAHMTSFLENLMLPLHTVFSFGDLVRLRARHDIVVLGYFDFQTSPEPSGFAAFYNAATKALEKDLHRGVCFAITSQKETAKEFGLKFPKSLMMFRYNETLEYSEKSIFRSDVILDWIFGNRKPIIQWLAPPRAKSLLLSTIFEAKGSALIMFTPRNPLVSSMPYFDLLREVALDYYDCNQSWQTSLLIKESAFLRERLSIDMVETEKMCTTLNKISESKEFQAQRHSISRCCRSVFLQGRACSVCIYELEAMHRCHSRMNCNSFSADTMEEKIMPSLKHLRNISSDVCSEFPLPFFLKLKSVLCCSVIPIKDSLDATKMPSNDLTTITVASDCSNLSNAVGYDGVDDRMHVLCHERNQSVCKRWHLQHQYSATSFPNSSFSDGIEYKFTGLGCRTNDSLTFITMDTIEFDAFSQRLGINASKMHHQTAVMIQNTQREIQYLLGKLVTKRNLVEFIWNYTHGRLDHFLRSDQEASPCTVGQDDICSQEVTSSSFLRVVMEETQDVVLLYYAPWCGFCAGITHIYLKVAQYFRPITNLKLTRINGDQNDLPWQFTVGKYPTVLFFPAYRKSDSIPFPEDRPMTVPNLIYFVLANLQETSRLQMALTLCTSACIAQNRRRLFSTMQTMLHELKRLLVRRFHVQQALNSQRKVREAATLNLQEANLHHYKHYLTKQIQEIQTRLHYIKILHRSLQPFQTYLSDIQKRTILQNFHNYLWDFKQTGNAMQKGRKEESLSTTIFQRSHLLTPLFS